ncbi:exo-alpha-sialidase [Pedobacter helvus]|uniref:Exo-alpha-sialidase n=1 Tax=Pedobacter helvus TaxID=2563444 RepID=A0ABW9JS55_9SPHI|nr:exo-alpha-sialidase [Pedobacter ureilyticus]
MRKLCRYLLLVSFCFAALTGKAQEAVFANNYHSSTGLAKLAVEKAVIYTPNMVWHYAHHPSVVYFKRNFYAIFSNGVKGEDDPGQRILISKSANFEDWSLPQILKEPKIAADEIPYTLTPGGIFVHNDKLMLLYTENNIGDNYARLNVKLYAITSEDGEHWSEPVDLNIRLFPSHKPFLLPSGRFLITGNDVVYYTDDRSGLSGWTKAVYNGKREEVKATLVEGAFTVAKNGMLYNLLRSTGKTYDGFLYQSMSEDQGKTWSIPAKAKFTDNNSKSYLGQLPDGRYFHIGTPDTTNKGKRTPLVLSVSKDGLNYDKTFIVDDSNYQMKYKGKWKDGQFGYPYAYVNGKDLFIIYSRRKEQLEIVKIAISQLK